MKTKEEVIECIYKITSPTLKVYIGQTINYFNRIKKYSLLRCKSQIKLYNSLKKHGFKNHKFEIIEECAIDNLNERERYWQEYYNVLSNKGLNLKLTKTNDKNGSLSEQTKKKLSKSLIGKNKGNIMSLESRLKLSESKKGVKLSKEHSLKIGLSHLVFKHTEDSKLKMSQSKKGLKMSDDFKRKCSERLKGKSIDRFKRKIILNNKITFNSITEACKELGVSRSSVSNNLSGRTLKTKIGIWAYV